MKEIKQGPEPITPAERWKVYWVRVIERTDVLAGQLQEKLEGADPEKRRVLEAQIARLDELIKKFDSFYRDVDVKEEEPRLSREDQAFLEKIEKGDTTEPLE